jgi:hypothetical protein
VWEVRIAQKSGNESTLETLERRLRKFEEKHDSGYEPKRQKSTDGIDGLIEKLKKDFWSDELIITKDNISKLKETGRVTHINFEVPADKDYASMVIERIMNGEFPKLVDLNLGGAVVNVESMRKLAQMFNSRSAPRLEDLILNGDYDKYGYYVGGQPELVNSKRNDIINAFLRNVEIGTMDNIRKLDLSGHNLNGADHSRNLNVPGEALLTLKDKINQRLLPNCMDLDISDNGHNSKISASFNRLKLNGKLPKIRSLKLDERIDKDWRELFDFFS